MAIDGLEQLKRKLARIPKRMATEVKAALEAGADEMVVMSKGLVHVDDGVLKSTIKKRPGRHEFAVEVVAGGAETTRSVRKTAKGNAPTYDYAVAQEFGTAEMKANPYFFPAYRALRRRIKSRITRAGSKALKEEAGK